MTFSKMKLFFKIFFGFFPVLEKFGPALLKNEQTPPPKTIKFNSISHSIPVYWVNFFLAFWNYSALWAFSWNLYKICTIFSLRMVQILSQYHIFGQNLTFSPSTLTEIRTKFALLSRLLTEIRTNFALLSYLRFGQIFWDSNKFCPNLTLAENRT